MKADVNTSGLQRLQPFLIVGGALEGIEATLCNSSTWAEGLTDSLPPMRENEVARVTKLRDSDVAKRLRDSLVCGRVMLGERLGLSAHEVCITRSSEGAPQLENRLETSVSISRSGNWTLVALGDGRAIGADVEVMRTLDWRVMLGMVCSDPEAKAFLAFAEREPDQTLRAFFTLWTIKEAVLKATGRGMRAGAKSVAVSVDDLVSRVQPLREIEVAGTVYTVWSGWEVDVALSLAIARD